MTFTSLTIADDPDWGDFVLSGAIAAAFVASALATRDSFWLSMGLLALSWLSVVFFFRISRWTIEDAGLRRTDKRILRAPPSKRIEETLIPWPQVNCYALVRRKAFGLAVLDLENAPDSALVAISVKSRAALYAFLEALKRKRETCPRISLFKTATGIKLIVLAILCIVWPSTVFFTPFFLATDSTTVASILIATSFTLFLIFMLLKPRK